MDAYSSAHRYSAKTANGQRHKQKRKKKMLFFYVIFILLFVSLAFIIIFSTFFHIRIIKVEGAQIYSTDKIIELSGLKIGDNLLDFNIKNAAYNIENSLSNIENAEIKLNLSGTVLVTVSEAKPSVVIAYKDKYAVLSKYMKVLQADLDFVPQQNLTYVTGLEILPPEEGRRAVFDNMYDEKLDYMNKIISYIDKNGLDGQKKLDLNEPLEISLEYDSRIAIRLGTMNKMERKIENIKKIIESDTVDKGFYVIDAYLEESKSPRIGLRSVSSLEDYYKTKTGLIAPFKPNFGKNESSVATESIGEELEGKEIKE